MFKIKSISQLLVLVTGLVCSPALMAQNSVTVDSTGTKFALTGGTLIDGSGAAPLDNAILLINNGVIEAVGQLGSLAIPTDYAVISTEGRTMMPGLWDMHVHLLYAGHTNFPYWHQTYTDQFAETIMPATALQLLQSGVTSARDLGAPPEAIFQIRQQIASNEIPGPTLYASGPQLASPFPEWAQYYRRNISGTANAMAEARALVELEADILKISGAEQLSIDDVRTVTDIAHAQGLLVTAHGRTDAEIEIGLAGNIDEFQHIGAASDEFPDSVMSLIRARLASGNELYWTPTVGIQLREGRAIEDLELLDDPENYMGLPQAIIEDIQTALQSYNPRVTSIDTVKRKITQLQEAGVTLLVGTDGGLSGNPHAQAMWQEMLTWVNVLGIDPMQTIYAATALPAQLMGVDDLVGTLTVGKLADVIVVHGNPLQNMSVLQDPEMVFKHGVRF